MNLEEDFFYDEKPRSGDCFSVIISIKLGYLPWGHNPIVLRFSVVYPILLLFIIIDVIGLTYWKLSQQFWDEKFYGKTRTQSFP